MATANRDEFDEFGGNRGRNIGGYEPRKGASNYSANIRISGPSDGETVRSHFRVEGTAEITWWQSYGFDSDAIQKSAPPDKVEISIDGNFVGNATRSPVAAGTYTYPWAYVANVDQGGLHKITVKATWPRYSYKGWVREASVNVNIDSVGPDLKIHRATLIPPGTVIIEGSAKDNYRVASVQCLVNGASVVNPEDRSGIGDWSTWRAVVPLPNLSQRHVIAVSAKDGTAHDTTIFLPPLVAFTKPIIDISKPYTWPDPWQGDDIDVEFQGVATGGAGPLKVVEYAHYHDPNLPDSEVDKLFQQADRLTDDWSTWRTAFRLDRSGNHFVTVRAQDEQGQKSERVTLPLVVKVRL